MSVEFTAEREAELFARINARRDAGDLVDEHGSDAPAIALGRLEAAKEIGPQELTHWQLVGLYAAQLIRQQAMIPANDDVVSDGLELLRAFYEISDPIARRLVIDVAQLFSGCQRLRSNC